MTDRPILMSAPMVRAILSGAKTQTRRVVKARKDREFGCELAPCELAGEANSGEYSNAYCAPGDRLWVREAWRTSKVADELKPSELVGGSCSPVWYEAQDEVPFHPSNFGKLRPSMFMPRWASRITLEITAVRVERLQDISEADALAEGIVPTHDGYGLPDGSHYHAADPRISYWSLWDAINGQGSTESNPWVWVVSFRRVP